MTDAGLDTIIAAMYPPSSVLCHLSSDPMPICEADPWRLQYFAHVTTAANIPTEDSDAWQWYPAHRFVYDKLALALSQNLEAGPHGIAPPRYPVFSKPIVNLKGMGVGSRMLDSPADYEAHYAPGHFWMTLLHGRHVSSDIAVVDGEPRWWRHVTGKPAGEGTFDYWTVHAEPEPGIEAHCGAMDRKKSRRLHRHAQSRNHRRNHHRGAFALCRPMARSLRSRLGRRGGRPLRAARLGF